MRYNRRPLNISYNDHVTNERSRCNWSDCEEAEIRMVMATSQSPLARQRQSFRDNERRKEERKMNKRWDDNIKVWTGTGFGDSLRVAEEGKCEKVLL